MQKADNFGSTPLHLACIYGHVHCVRTLCELVSSLDKHQFFVNLSKNIEYNAFPEEIEFGGT